MKRFRRYRDSGRRLVDINMAPLIDMTFILLIFFIVTTSFVRESGVAVERPTAATARTEAGTSLQIGVTAEGLIMIDGQPVDLRRVRARAERFRAEYPEAGAIIVADRHSASGLVIELLDQCRLAGIRQVSVAAETAKAP